MTQDKLISMTKVQSFLDEMANNARDNGYPESVETIQSVQDHLLEFAGDNTPAAPDAEALEAFNRIIKLAVMSDCSRGIDEDDVDLVRAALQSQAPSVVKPPLGNAPKWVNCPICHEPDMRMSTTAEGETLIHCVNHGCRSNTVAPSVDDAVLMEAIKSIESWNSRRQIYAVTAVPLSSEIDLVTKTIRALLSGTAKKVGD